MDTLYDKLYECLKSKHIPIAHNGKVGITGKRTITFGFRMKTLGNQNFGACTNNVKRPDLWKLIKQLGATLSIPWDSVQVNENAICGPHRDKNNVGLSYIVSLGDYLGGDLMIQHPDTTTTTHSCNRNGLIFDGSNIHWNTPHTGTKYSLVYYSIEPSQKQLEKFGYSPDWRQHPTYLSTMCIT